MMVAVAVVAECSKRRIPRPYRRLHGQRGAARDPLPSVGVHIVIVDRFGVGNRLPHALQQLQGGERTSWSFSRGGPTNDEEKEEDVGLYQLRCAVVYILPAVPLEDVLDVLRRHAAHVRDTLCDSAIQVSIATDGVKSSKGTPLTWQTIVVILPSASQHQGFLLPAQAWAAPRCGSTSRPKAPIQTAITPHSAVHGCAPAPFASSLQPRDFHTARNVAAQSIAAETFLPRRGGEIRIL